MDLKLHKKGIMFTVLSVLVCALLITSFFMYQSVPLDSDVDNIKIRINNVDRFVSETDVYIRSITNAAGIQTIDNLTNGMMNNNRYLFNFTKEFESCLMTGRFNASWNPPVWTNCPPNTKLDNRFEYLENFSRNKLNIDANISLNSIKLTQNNPWYLTVLINYTIVINDSYALWNETRIVETHIQIQGLNDPTSYIIPNSLFELQGIRQKSKINVSTTRQWYEFPSTAHQFVLNKKYMYWAAAPSYLNRLNNDMESSPCCGIVNIVSNDYINVGSLPTNINRSYHDYEFWKNVNVDGNFYRRYNFWHPSMEPGGTAYRYNAWINTTRPGLNGSIISETLAAQINMTNSSYLRVYPYT
jgi:hypothetical protein